MTSTHGTVQTRKNRLTRTFITIAKPWHFAMEDHEDHKWIASCDTHGQWVGCTTKQLAQLSGSYPDFCYKCKETIDNNIFNQNLCGEILLGRS